MTLDRSRWYGNESYRARPDSFPGKVRQRRLVRYTGVPDCQKCSTRGDWTSSEQPTCVDPFRSSHNLDYQTFWREKTLLKTGVSHGQNLSQNLGNLASGVLKIYHQGPIIRTLLIPKHMLS